MILNNQPTQTFLPSFNGIILTSACEVLFVVVVARKLSSRRKIASAVIVHPLSNAVFSIFSFSSTGTRRFIWGSLGAM